MRSHHKKKPNQPVFFRWNVQKGCRIHCAHHGFCLGSLDQKEAKFLVLPTPIDININKQRTTRKIPCNTPPSEDRMSGCESFIQQILSEFIPNVYHSFIQSHAAQHYNSITIFKTWTFLR